MVLSALVPRAGVKLGKKVRDFTLPATGNKTINLQGLKGKLVVLFFYPKDSTPGCTIEGREFTQLHKQFSGKNAEVFGVSRDSMKSHENFKSKQSYSVDLLSDADEELCDLFGVIKMKNMYGRQVRGIERSTFLIDENGVLVKEWRGVKAEGHAQEVLRFLTGL
ncbi:MAG: peroxiredoxin [Bdellovibrionaceae bacterium]|nr:peroxiredoxin [Bdellovibrionales bacterium]MCB9084794.1 peroxiredoxin [Pseudobdellovibrionaceae bacterium]